MQSKVFEKPYETTVDFEFEISGDKFSELDWEQLCMIKPKNHEIAIAIDRTLMKSLWEIVSLEELKTTIIKNLSFLNLVKVKLDFDEKPLPRYPKHGGIFIPYVSVGINNALNAIESIPESFSEKLFGWVYYKDKNDNLETFRFTINIETGEIKYFD